MLTKYGRQEGRDRYSVGEFICMDHLHHFLVRTSVIYIYIIVEVYIFIEVIIF